MQFQWSHFKIVPVGIEPVAVNVVDFLFQRVDLSTDLGLGHQDVNVLIAQWARRNPEVAFVVDVDAAFPVRI